MLDRFRQACADPDGEVARALAEGRRPIRVLGTDAPRARLIAAGFQPIRLVAPPLVATPRADAVMGAAELGPRGRRLLEALLTLPHPGVPLLITQADSVQPQLFAALRELGRLGEAVPEHVHFLDLLHLDRPASRAYNAARLAQLDAWLGGFGASPGTMDPDLTALLARAAELQGTGRLSGSDALAVAGGCAVLPVDEARAALSDLLAADLFAADLPVRASGPRIVVCGTAHDDARLYGAIEAAGGAIVGAVHAWSLTPLALPARVADPTATAARVADAAARLRPDLMLHLTIDGDEAAPWDVPALRRTLPADQRFAALRCSSAPDDRFMHELAVALGRAEPAAAPTRPARPTASRPAPPRSRKALGSTGDVNAWQRDWFASVRQAVAKGSPFAVVNANAPQEILRAMDVPFVVNQWWASIVAAKQQSRRYQGLLRDHDYPADVEAYSAQGLAALFDDDPDNAPWGGLPRPDFVHAVASSDPTLKLFTQWGAASGADCYVYERTIDPRPDLYSDWWDQLPDRWETAVEPERVDLMVAEMREVIARIEARTGRRFDPARFAEVMALVNEQEDYYRKTRDLVARTVPAPIGVVDSMPATMVPQWHRGTVWARDAARAL
ncbi:2-hydroxyacyl-CoA dehydratase family protein, partial [Novosphingobium sp.]|uniref:2-hydroxyacyl-CoA dehydratase family protein n=1 Tax=Novosphingobium sp. TaxID=1874826 RepID=UPI002638BF6F